MFAKPSKIKTVSEESFIKKMCAAGFTKTQAEMHVKVSKIFGSCVQVGKEFLQVRKKKSHPRRPER